VFEEKVVPFLTKQQQQQQPQAGQELGGLLPQQQAGQQHQQQQHCMLGSRDTQDMGNCQVDSNHMQD
jgi:hypothetical protein